MHEKNSESGRRSFRLVCSPAEVPLVEALLAAQGFAFEPEPFFPLARRLTVEPFPLGRSQAAFWGLIYIQDRSSMLPPLALAPAEGDIVLDMCASPGSKTGLLAQMTGTRGLVLANEPTRTRLATLRRNLLALNLLQTVTCSWPGERLPMADASWDRILLDPPCSGWGTTDRHPQIMTLWRDEKVAPLIALQRKLLTEATRLLAPGGRLVFSTCTTNVDENEAQVRYAADVLGLEPVPLEPFPGFVFAQPLLPGCEGSLRVDGDASAAQGFFIACLRKPGGEASPTPDSGPRKGASPAFPPPLSPSATSTPPYQPLPLSLLASFGLDPARLPQGRLGRFGDSVHFLPEHALARLPASLRWQGTALGKAAGEGCIPSPRLRLLSHAPEEVTRGRAVRLDVDEVTELDALIQGRSLVSTDPAHRSAKEANLFWRGLPLGRLRLKGGRALWSER